MPALALADECPAGGEHEYAAELVRQATEDADGLRRFTCVKCGNAYEQVIPATGHEWGPWIVDVAPTCTSSGIEHRECARHAATPHREERTIAPLSATGEHAWMETSRIEATCEHDGEVQYACSACGETKTEVLPALGHEWGPWETVREATAGSEGLERRVCRRDASHAEERTMPVAAPAPAQEPAPAAAAMEEPRQEHPQSASVPSASAPQAPASSVQPREQPNPWAPNALDAILLGVDAAAIAVFAIAAAPLIGAWRWAAARRREAEEAARSLGGKRGGRVL